MIKKLFSSCCILLLLLCASLRSNSQTHDVFGWRNARWGMSETELVKAFGPELKKLRTAEKFSSRHVDYAIPEYELDGNFYTVFFQMDDKTNRLDQILIRLNEMETQNPREREFNRLESLLTQDYGLPAQTSDRKFAQPLAKFKIVDLKRAWRFPTSSIELSYGWDNQVFSSLLSIRFFPTERDAPVLISRVSQQFPDPNLRP
jgi:hypothetical protein